MFLVIDGEQDLVDSNLLNAFLVIAAIGSLETTEALARRVQDSPARKNADEWDRFVRLLAAAVLGDRTRFDEERAAIARRKVNRGYTALLAPYVPALDAVLRGDAAAFEEELNRALELFSQRPKNRDIDQYDALSGGQGSIGLAIDYLSVFLIRLAGWRGLVFAMPESPYLPKVLRGAPLIKDLRRAAKRALNA